MRAWAKCFWAGLAVLAAPAIGQNGTACARCDQVQVQPYMAEFKLTHVQTLADGTTITRETKEIEAVDSQGRRLNAFSMLMPFNTTNEQMMHFSVHDPVENTQATWDSRTKSARVIKEPSDDQRHGCWANGEGNYRMNFGPMRPLGQPPAGASVSVGSGGIGAGSGRVEMGSLSSVVVTSRVEVTSSSSSASMPALAPGVTPPVPPVSVPNPAANNAAREDLGTDVVQGVEVHGYRTTRTIPVGQIGNDKPIVTTNESWNAPSLGGLSLRTVNDSPQSGRQTREVVSLNIGNPDPSVFQPPEGYKVTLDELHQVPCDSTVLR